MWTSPKITPVSKLRNGKALRGGIDPRVTGMSVARVNRAGGAVGVARSGCCPGCRAPSSLPTCGHGQAHIFAIVTAVVMTGLCSISVCKALPLSSWVAQSKSAQPVLAAPFTDEETEAQRDKDT